MLKQKTSTTESGKAVTYIKENTDNLIKKPLFPFTRRPEYSKIVPMSQNYAGFKQKPAKPDAKNAFGIFGETSGQRILLPNRSGSTDNLCENPNRLI
jgi:hypothetical protein